jgi:triosephosphate isomerase
MQKPLLFVANWKMNLFFDQAVEYISTQYDSFCALADKVPAGLVLCPSFDSLYPISQLVKATSIAVGAQDCSAHHKGSFTGQVSAESLQALGIKYCIIGHSERRMNNAESNEDVAKKCRQLFDCGISPVVCVGETKADYDSGRTLSVLEEQLQPVIVAMKDYAPLDKHLRFCIAYEPVWSIGTGEIASLDHLETVFAWLSQQLEWLDTRNIRLLYGGSVNLKALEKLVKITQFHGFLIGGASLRFKEFEKIINYTLDNS